MIRFEEDHNLPDELLEEVTGTVDETLAALHDTDPETYYQEAQPTTTTEKINVTYKADDGQAVL